MTEIITFLNRNADRDLEQRVLQLLADLLAADARHAGELARYLDPRLAALLGLEPAPPPEAAPARPEHPRLALLYAFLAVGLAAVPAACLAVAALGARPGAPVAAGFFPRWIAAFNAAFAVYAASLNGGYLLLLAFSIAGSRAQARAAALLGEPLLFTRDLLPSVSIISPGLQRGGLDRGERQRAARPALPRLRGDRGERRLPRPHARAPGGALRARADRRLRAPLPRHAGDPGGLGEPPATPACW